MTLLNSFSGVIDTAETVSAVSMTLLKLFQRSHWHRWNLYDIAETEKRLCESLAFFKENIQQNYYMGKYPHTR
jgi:hypothetical protein